MPDIATSCIQCKGKFVISEKEQELHYRHNLAQPLRCAKCRSRKEPAGEANSKFEIVCDICGKHDHVPFRPKPGRAVLCADCHGARRSRGRLG